jgi:hypothetical protein
MRLSLVMRGVIQGATDRMSGITENDDVRIGERKIYDVFGQGSSFQRCANQLATAD